MTRKKKGVETHVYLVFVVKRKSSECKEKVFDLNLHFYLIKSNVNSQYYTVAEMDNLFLIYKIYKQNKIGILESVVSVKNSVYHSALNKNMETV